MGVGVSTHCILTDFEDFSCGSLMGLASSTSTSKSRRLIASKLETAGKTGVLNLADLVRITLSVSVNKWTHL